MSDVIANVFGCSSNGLFLIVHDLTSDTHTEYRHDRIPDNIKWAFDQILDQDCGSISCGTTVYEVKRKNWTDALYTA